MLRLYLLAHAPTAAQRQARFPADEGIEPVDRSDVDRVRVAIGRCNQIWRGPEVRCAETAAALGLEAEASADLRTWSPGSWSGQTIAWLADHDPATLRSWRTDPSFAPPGGESLTTLLDRIAAWVRTQERTNGRVLAIADSAVIRAALVSVLAAEARSFWRLDVAPWSLAIVQYANGEWRLRSLGVVARQEDGG